MEALEERLTPSGDTLVILSAYQPTTPNQPTGALTVELQDGSGHMVTATSNVTVNLSSSSSTGQFLHLTGKALYNSSLVIPTGSSFALFEYEDSQTGRPTLTATASGFSPGLASANIQDVLVFSTLGQALTTGQPSQPITVQLQDGNGNPVTATSNLTVTLSGGTSTGKFLDTSGNALPSNSITIAAGSSSASFEYEDSQTGYAFLNAYLSTTGSYITQEESVGNALFIPPPEQLLKPSQVSKPITVELESAASSAVTINLTSSSSTGKFLDPSTGNPITSITIPAGSTSGQFEYEDSKKGNASLFAVEANNSSAYAYANEQIGGSLGIPSIVSPAQALALNQPSQVMTVQLLSNGQPAPAITSVTLTLSSTSSGGTFLDTLGNPITSITIPAGSSFASFEYKDSQTGLPELTVSEKNFASSLQMEVAGSVSLAFTTPPQTFSAGQASPAMTVQLQDSNGNPITATSNVYVYLRSSDYTGQFLNTSGQNIYGSVEIAAGSSSASFEYKSAWGGSPTLTASVSGGVPNVPSLTTTQKETVNGLSALAFTTSPQTATAGQNSGLVTIQLEDNNGVPTNAPSGGLTVDLYASLGGFSSGSPIKLLDANGNPLTQSGYYYTITIPGGSNSVSFEYESTYAASFYIQASIPSSPIYAFQKDTVQAGPLHSVLLSSGQSLLAGTPSGSMTVTPVDQYNNPITAGSGGMAVSLSSTSSGGTFLDAYGDPLSNPTITVPQGSSSATFEYQDSQAGTPTLTATVNGFSGTQKETVNAVSSAIVVSNNNDSGSGSLRAAITAANAAPGSSIVFASGVTGTIDLLSALPTITASTNIIGPGANLLTIERSASATGTFGGFVIGGSSILSIPTVTISGLTVSNFNDTGIANEIGYLTLRQVVVSNNNASGMNLPPYGDPGGILNDFYLTVLDSTIANNSTSQSLVAAGIDSEGANVLIANSTIAGNVDNNSNSAGGVGIYNGSAFIVSSTISGNKATRQTGTLNNSGGGVDAYGATPVVLYDTIVAGNTGSVNNPTDVSGAFLSQGNNMIGKANSQSTGFVSSDKVGTTTTPINAKLGSLANNGGPTPTMALLTGSPALLAGSGANAPTTDQRGDPRPQGTIDIGAFQLSAIGFSPASLPAGTVNTAYNQTITATSTKGTTTVSYSITTGTLPAGLKITNKNGVLTIKGTPTAAGTVTFTVKAKDAASDTATWTYTLTIS